MIQFLTKKCFLFRSCYDWFSLQQNVGPDVDTGLLLQGVVCVRVEDSDGGERQVQQSLYSSAAGNYQKY